MPTSALSDIQHQDVLQAVVIADNFNNNLMPVTLEHPAVLFPVANKVLLDYTLEALEHFGIQEVFIFSCSHHQQIRNYIKSHWSVSHKITISVISSESFMSLGDAIRELDSKALIRSDFVLINGTVVTTVDLYDVLSKHRKCRQIDKNCALTLIYRQALPNHKTRCKGDNCVLAVATNNKKICFYQKLKNEKSVHIPLEVFQGDAEVTVHYDAINCHIYICSPCIPPLYADNFDFQTMDDLIKGLITNEEVLGNTIYLHLAQQCYAADVTDFSMYDIISCDILQRWVYPIVPDLFLSSSFHHLRHHIYKGRNVDLHRNCNLSQNVIIGDESRVGDDSFIENSVIGRNCCIGANVTIKGSYLWDNVVVGDNCSLNSCLLAHNVTVKENVAIASGCIIGNKVVIGNYVTLPKFTRLQFVPPKQNDDFEDAYSDDEISEVPACNPEFVGVDGCGYVYEESESDSEKNVWGDTLSENQEGNEKANTDDSSDLPSSSSSSVMNEDDSNEEQTAEDDEVHLFYNEVLDSLQRGIEEKIKPENLILEINSSKYAYNVTMKDVNYLVLKSMLEISHMKLHGNCPNPQAYFITLKSTLMCFLPIIKNYIKNSDSQLDCLNAVKDFLVSHKELCVTISKILHFLYENGILNESKILQWYDSLETSEESMKQFVTPFATWLKEADEESSEEDEDDD